MEKSDKVRILSHFSHTDMKTCSVQSKRRDQYHSDNRVKNDNTKPLIHINHDD